MNQTLANFGRCVRCSVLNRVRRSESGERNVISQFADPGNMETIIFCQLNSNPSSTRQTRDIVTYGGCPKGTPRNELMDFDEAPLNDP
jgi:hypothetical protein